MTESSNMNATRFVNRRHALKQLACGFGCVGFVGIGVAHADPSSQIALKVVREGKEKVVPKYWSGYCATQLVWLLLSSGYNSSRDVATQERWDEVTNSGNYILAKYFPSLSLPVLMDLPTRGGQEVALNQIQRIDEILCPWNLQRHPGHIWAKQGEKMGAWTKFKTEDYLQVIRPLINYE